jgi:hypothetical protein
LRRSLKDQEQVDKIITELKNDIENFEVILAKQDFLLLQVIVQELSPLEESDEDSEEDEIDEEIENSDQNEEVFIENFDTKLYDQIKRSILDSFS